MQIAMLPVGRRSACASRRFLPHPADHPLIPQITCSSRRSPAHPADHHPLPTVTIGSVIGFCARFRPRKAGRKAARGLRKCLHKHTWIYPLTIALQEQRCFGLQQYFLSTPIPCVVQTPAIVWGETSTICTYPLPSANMVFSSPAWVPPIPGEVPDSVPLSTFALSGSDDAVGQDDSRALLADGLSGKTFSRGMLRQRVEFLARALAQRLGWSPNEGSPWDKVAAIHSLNSVGVVRVVQRICCGSLTFRRSHYQIDYFVVCWAIHRLNGIVLPLHSTSTVTEITTHMLSAKCSTIFTCQPLLPIAVEATTQLSIPQNRMFILNLPEEFFKTRDAGGSGPFIDTETLITEGSELEPLDPLIWKDGQAKEQVAYLCATSGTSGKQVSTPKG